MSSGKPNEKAAKYDDKLIEWKDLPPWMRDNEFIVTSYRKASYSYSRSIRTITRLHNETINIWTHLLGALLFLTSLTHFHRTLTTSILPSTPSPSDLAALSLYYTSVANCFLLSTFFHLFSNHSPSTHRLGNSLDHIGIVFVIYGSSFPATYFEFYCDEHRHLRYGYWSLSTCFAFLSAVFTLRPKFRTPAYRKVRFYMYALLGLSTFFPVVHGLQIWTFQELDERMGLRWFVGLGVLNFSGAAVYAMRVPERWWPRRFDVVGSSHQIMHVLVVLGALSHERGLVGALRWWRGTVLEEGGLNGACPG